MSTTTALVGPRAKPRTQTLPVRPAAVPSVLHVDAGREWGGGQNQVRLLMHELNELGLRQLCLCPQDSALHQRLLEERLPVRGITRRFAINPVGVSELASRLRGFNLVHTHDAHALQMMLLPARLLAVPVVASRRASFRTSALKWNRAHRVIAVSVNVRDTLLEAGVKPWKIRLVHSGIDAREVRSLPPSEPSLRVIGRVPPDAFLAGSIGALIECKNHRTIVQAAAQTENVCWALVGEGAMRHELERSIHEHNVGQQVFLTGHIEDARRVLRELDVFVFASIGEALGTSVLDAMAAGIPVIAADSAGPAEVLAPVHARTGRTLYPPGDAEALARLVAGVRMDPVLRERMIAAQNTRIEDFRSERTAMKTLDVYREILW